jgi:hypothetical protein
MHTVKHDLRGKLWCGPAALSAITGRGTREVRDALWTFYGDREPVRGVPRTAMLRVLEAMGYGFRALWEWNPDYRNPTLRQFEKHFRPVLGELPVLCGVTRHWTVLQEGLFVDSWTKKPLPFAQAPAEIRRRHVWYAYQIFQRT